MCRRGVLYNLADATIGVETESILKHNPYRKRAYIFLLLKIRTHILEIRSLHHTSLLLMMFS